VLDRVLSVQLPEREAVARTLRLGELTLDLTASRRAGRTSPSS
jgi:two-component system phosphate regulon response regulator PhoB